MWWKLEAVYRRSGKSLKFPDFVLYYKNCRNRKTASLAIRVTTLARPIPGIAARCRDFDRLGNGIAAAVTQGKRRRRPEDRNGQGCLPMIGAFPKQLRRRESMTPAASAAD
jgi:hypothetical protein